MQLEGADELSILIRNAGIKAEKGVFEQMRREAVKIQELARKFAPIDHGPLEDSIKVSTEGGGRDDMGRFVRKALSVYIDPDDEAHDGRNVGQYAYVMHELLLPFGAGGFKLGKKSQQKQMGQSEIVGGRFLERAAEEVSRGLMNRLIEVARREF
jgi:hypothetical protein